MTEEEYYSKMHKACPLFVGDKVRINYRGGGIHDGTIGVIARKNDQHYLVRTSDGLIDGYPYYALTPAEKESPMDSFIDDLGSSCDDFKGAIKAVVNKMVEVYGLEKK